MSTAGIPEPNIGKCRTAQRVTLWVCLLALAFVVLSACSCMVSAAAGSETESGMLNCGIGSVLALKEMIGSSPTGDRASDLSGRFGSGSMSMLEVQELGLELGIELVGQRVSLEALISQNGLFIAHMKIGHFVAVDSVSPTYVRVLRLGDWPILVPTVDFAKEFSGNVLSFKGASASGLVVDGIHDFGNRVETGSLSAEFNIENKSTSAIKLIEIDSECACTVVAPKSRLIDSGDHSTISVYFVAGEEPVFQKHIRIVTDDPARPIYYLSICGAGGPYVRSDPANLYMGEIVRHSETEPGRVRLAANGASQRFITKIVSSADWLVAESASEGNEIIVAASATSAPVGSFYERLTVTVSTPGQTSITIPVSGEIVNQIKLQPAEVFFGAVDRGATHSRIIRFTDRCGGVVKITSVDTVPGLTTTNTEDTLTVSLGDIPNQAVFDEVVPVHILGQSQAVLVPVFAVFDELPVKTPN